MQNKKYWSARRATVPAILVAVGSWATFSWAGAASVVDTAPAAYSITDLGTLGGATDSQAFSINNYGQVAGSSNADTFLWTPDEPNGITGSMTDLGPSISAFETIKVNDDGQVIFYSNGTFLWTPAEPNGTTGSITDIGSLAGGIRVRGIGLNNIGQISGYGYPGVCFLWTPDVPNGTTGTFNRYFNGTSYEPGFGQSSYSGEANGVNDSGFVTGSISTGPFFPIIHGNAYDHYTTGDVIPAYAPPDWTGTGWAINALGHVTGTVNFPSTSSRRPFLYDGSAMIDITSLESGTGRAINSNDAVVGKAIFPIIGGRPFLHTGGMLFDLNDLLPPDSDWTLVDVFAINDSGQIVGFGTHAGHTRAFLMTPPSVERQRHMPVAAS
jgi:uncharacterized membrane protein